MSTSGKRPATFPLAAQRYRQLVENQIVPHLGAKALQKVTRLDVEGWHTTLRNGGLAARNIGHAHRVLGGALRDAERDGVVIKNVCKIQKAPKVPETEMVIVQDVPAFIAKIVGARLYVPAVVALCTGLRLGELLALRDRRLDLDRKVMEVAEALEETKAKGIAEIKNRSPQAHSAGYRGRRFARASQAAARTADEARARQTRA